MIGKYLAYKCGKKKALKQIEFEEYMRADPIDQSKYYYDSETDSYKRTTSSDN